MLSLTRLSFLLFGILATSALFAQDEAASDPLVEKATVEGIAVEDLNSLLFPMTIDQVEAVAIAWQGKAKETLVQIADVNIEMRSAEGGAKTELTTRRSELDSLKSLRLERFRTAYLKFRDLGGDMASYDAWYDEVSGLQVDTKDAAAATGVLLDWLKKEDGGIKWAKSIIFALLTLLIFKFLSALAGRVTGGAMKRAKISISEGLRRFFLGIVKKLVMIIGVILALSMLGVDIAPLVAALGVGGFVLGFALQDTLGNFAAGIMILMYRPFEIGHVVSAAGITGKVEDISLVSTRFLTPDNQTIIVPNGSVWGGVITNITGNDSRRVDMVFGIGYDDDIEKAEKVLTEIVTSHPKVLQDPAPVVKLAVLADSSVNFNVRPWSATADYWDVHFDVTKTVKKRFDEEGISIPYPQQDVHMHTVS